MKLLAFIHFFLLAVPTEMKTGKEERGGLWYVV